MEKEVHKLRGHKQQLKIKKVGSPIPTDRSTLIRSLGLLPLVNNFLQESEIILSYLFNV